VSVAFLCHRFRLR